MKSKNTIRIWLRAFENASAALTPSLLAMQDLNEILIRHDPVARIALEALSESLLAPIRARAAAEGNR
jgi:hypothetical protein